MENKRNEQVIYLKDLLFVLLRGWRKLLIAAVVLGVLLGGLKLFRGVQEITAANDAAAAALPQAKQEYSQALKMADSAVELAEKERDDQKEYMEESIYLRLNPRGYYLAEVTFFVQPNSSAASTAVDRILNQYVTTLQSNPVMARISKAMGEGLKYVREVCYVEADPEAITIHVVCSCDTEEMAEKFLAAVKEEVVAAQDKIALVRGSHKLLLIEEGTSKQISMELEQKRKEAKALLSSMDAKVEETKAARAAMTEPVAAMLPRSGAVKPAIKHAVLGAAIGVAVVVVCLWLRHVFGSKVYSARVLTNVTGVKLLGCVSGKNIKNPIDRWLLKLEGREIDDREARIKLLAADIRNRCSEYTQLLVTGDGDAKSRETLVEALAEEIPGIRLVDMGSLLQAPEAVDALSANDAVLLVEQCGSSLYGRVEKELDMIADYGKTLVGCVLLDG